MILNIIKNMVSAGYYGSEFGQDVEASGTYVLEKDSDYILSGWVEGTAEVVKPLIIPINDETRISYKYELSNQFKAKGKGLTKKLMTLGYDCIITKEPNGSSSEIILFPNAKFMLHPLSEGKTLIKDLLRKGLNDMK